MSSTRSTLLGLRRCLMFVLAFITLVGRVSSQRTPIRLGEWMQMSKTGSPWELSQNTLPFAPADNLRYCARRTITIRRDGRRDYAAIINQKLDVLGKQGGGTVKLAAGVYPHSAQIVMPSYTCLVGAGIDSTFLFLVDNAPRFRYSGSIRSLHTERITIMDLTQDGNRANQGTNKRRNYGRYGMFTELTNFLYMKNFRVKNNFAYGFDPHGSKVHWSYYLIMEDCEALGNGLDGFTIDQTVHASIIRGYSANNDRHGYNIVTGTQMALFRDCVSFNNGVATGVGFGYTVQNNHQKGTNRITFERCESNEDHRGGFKIREVFAIWVSDSTVIGKGSAVCYELSYCNGINLLRNNCRVRANRKFKIGTDVFYREVGDRSMLIPNTPTTPTVVAVADPLPDPRCVRGVSAGNLCCASSCTICGGPGCGSKANGPGGNFCCASPIRLAGKKCSVAGAPCLK